MIIMKYILASLQTLMGILFPVQEPYAEEAGISTPNIFPWASLSASTIHALIVLLQDLLEQPQQADDKEPREIMMMDDPAPHDCTGDQNASSLFDLELKSSMSHLLSRICQEHIATLQKTSSLATDPVSCSPSSIEETCESGGDEDDALATSRYVPAASSLAKDTLSAIQLNGSGCLSASALQLSVSVFIRLALHISQLTDITPPMTCLRAESGGAWKDCSAGGTSICSLLEENMQSCALILKHHPPLLQCFMSDNRYRALNDVEVNTACMCVLLHWKRLGSSVDS
jgi:hypothetical protein